MNSVQEHLSAPLYVYYAYTQVCGEEHFCFLLTELKQKTKNSCRILLLLFLSIHHLHSMTSLALCIQYSK